MYFGLQFVNWQAFAALTPKPLTVISALNDNGHHQSINRICSTRIPFVVSQP